MAATFHGIRGDIAMAKKKAKKPKKAAGPKKVFIMGGYLADGTRYEAGDSADDIPDEDKKSLKLNITDAPKQG